MKIFFKKCRWYNENLLQIIEQQRLSLLKGFKGNFEPRISEKEKQQKLLDKKKKSLNNRKTKE